MSGILAEKYKNGNLSEILKEYKNHRAIASRTLEEEKLTPLADYQLAHKWTSIEEKDGKSTINNNPILEQDGQKFVKEIVPGKTITGYKLYKNAVLLGTNIYRNILTPVYMKREDRTRHHYMIGKSGTWKSVFLQTMARQDLWNGDGICLIDPHGDLAEDVLSFVPKERAKDVVYFDAGNEDRPMGLNLYEINTLDEADRTVNDATEIFLKMFGPEIFGPRIQDYFRNGCLLLMDQPEGGTIVDIMRLFTDDAFAEAKIRNLKDPVVAAWWNKTYKRMGDREKAEIIPFIQAKFWPFTTGVYVRNIIGQPKSAFKMYDAMQQKKIILMNLAKGIAGEETSKLIGKIIAMQVKLSALKRAKIDEKDRVPHYLYVDEFQNYVSQSFESILSEARKYKVGLVVAHQYTDQLKQEGLGGNMDLSKTIFGNIGNMFVFKVGAPDAEFLTKEFEPEFNQTDLTSTAAFMGACKVSVNNQQTRPFSFEAKVLYPGFPDGLPYANSPEKVQIIKQISSLKRWTKRELVDREIYFRVGV